MTPQQIISPCRSTTIRRCHNIKSYLGRLFSGDIIPLCEDPLSSTLPAPAPAPVPVLLCAAFSLLTTCARGMDTGTESAVPAKIRATGPAAVQKREAGMVYREKVMVRLFFARDAMCVLHL